MINLVLIYQTRFLFWFRTKILPWMNKVSTCWNALYSTRNTRNWFMTCTWSNLEIFLTRRKPFDLCIDILNLCISKLFIMLFNSYFSVITIINMYIRVFLFMSFFIFTFLFWDTENFRSIPMEFKTFHLFFGRCFFFI